MATAYIPAIYFYYDITFNERKAETSILVGLFGEEGLRKFFKFSDTKLITLKFNLTLDSPRLEPLCLLHHHRHGHLLRRPSLVLPQPQHLGRLSDQPNYILSDNHS